LCPESFDTYRWRALFAKQIIVLALLMLDCAHAFAQSTLAVDARTQERVTVLIQEALAPSRTSRTPKSTNAAWENSLRWKRIFEKPRPHARATGLAIRDRDGTGRTSRAN
jgi:hypothetical protein